MKLTVATALFLLLISKVQTNITAGTTTTGTTTTDTTTDTTTTDTTTTDTTTTGTTTTGTTTDTTTTGTTTTGTTMTGTTTTGTTTTGTTATGTTATGTTVTGTTATGTSTTATGTTATSTTTTGTTATGTTATGTTATGTTATSTTATGTTATGTTATSTTTTGTTATSTTATGTTASTASSTSSTAVTTSTTSGTTLATTTPYPLCTIVNNSIVTGNFQLTVTPAILSSNSIFTVKINGSGNATVVLQAMSGGNFAGSWSAGNHTCTGGSPLFKISFTSNDTVLTAFWTSPANQNPVEIRAYIQVSDTYKLTKTLDPAPTTTPTKNAGSTSHTISTYMNPSMAFLFLLITTNLLS